MVDSLVQPPSFSNTLDFENVNAPFIVLDKNQYFLTKKAEKLNNFTEKLRVFTDKEEINLTSNGITDYFKLKLKDSILIVYGGIVVKADRYIKDDTPTELITQTTPLNMREIVVEMDKYEFLKKTKVYEYMLDKNKLLLSNMVAYEEMERTCIPKTEVPVELVSPMCVMGTGKDDELVNRTRMIDEFIHKTIPFDQLNVTEDKILNLSAGDVLVSDVRFIDGFEPSDDNEAISILNAKEMGYVVDEHMRDKVYVDNPNNNNTPINKETIEDLSDDYINTVDKFAFNIIIDREASRIDDNMIVSAEEARKIIKEYFDGLINPSINSFDEFKQYLSSLCDIDDIYIDYDFSIEGGKIYLGFDYDNMYSVFNSEAIKRILFEETGKFDPVKGKTFYSARYFKDQGEINKLAAYAQFINVPFDVGTDTIGEVFKQIRAIVAKLCILTPDAIPTVDVPDVPVFTPTTVVVPPVFPGHFVPYISVFMVEPFYMKEYKMFIDVPPVFPTNRTPYVQVFVDKPFYTDKYINTLIIPPFLPHDRLSYQGPEIPKPHPAGKAVCKGYNRTDGKKDRLMFFDSKDLCKKRRKVTSTRTINMMEVSISYTGSHIHGFYWYDYEKSIVVSAAKMAVLFLSDVMCRVSELSDYYMNVVIACNEEFGPGAGEEYGGETSCNIHRISNGSGISGAPDVDVQEQIMKIFDSFEFTLNGVKIDIFGKRTGSAILTETELAYNIAAYEPLPSWTIYGGDFYSLIVNEHARSIAAHTDSYVSGKRIDKGEYGGNALIVSLDRLSYNNGIVLAEYVNNKHPSREEYRFTSLADPLGIFSSDLHVSVSVLDAAIPYDNILVGNTTGQDMSMGREEFIANPPSIKTGGPKIKIWNPDEIDEVRASSLPYASIAEDSQGVVSVYGHVVFVVENESGSFRYDVAGGESLTVGRKEIPTIEYTDGTIVNKEHYTLEYRGSTLILGTVEDTDAPSPLSFTRDICDPWESNDLISEYGDFSLPLLPVVTIPNFRSPLVPIIRNVILKVPGACAPHQGGSSGIDPTNKNNISNLEDVCMDTLYQEPGEVPGAYMMNLSMQVTKSYVDKSGRNIVESGNIKMCMTFGVIDGIQNGKGDILAQGLSQDEINSAGGGGSPVTYMAPNPATRQFTSFSRGSASGNDVSIFTIDVLDIVRNAVYADGGFFSMDSHGRQLPIVMDPTGGRQEETTQPGTIKVGGFSSGGMMSFYKHAGQDPFRPIVQGYQGASEIDMINGKKMIATVPSKLTNAVATGMDDAGPLVSSIKGTQGHIFINNNNMQVVLPDGKAALSEARTVKVVQQ